MRSLRPGSVGAVLLALIAATLTVACASEPLTTSSDAAGMAGSASTLAGSTGSGGSESGGSGGSVSGNAGTFTTTCVPGTERCDCRPDGSCNRGFTCLSDLCVNAQGFCAFANDGYCDEPNICPPGTDPDCCAALHDGVCEEQSEGGSCPDGSDWFDCGYCVATLATDGFCDEPDLCPPGTDNDCCATRKNDVCEEASQGGKCLDGSDTYDCGYCPVVWIRDGICDEPEDCPEDSDGADCCAHFGDGVCEEASAGGECGVNSDWFDCDYCFPPWVSDGFCDEIQQGGSCPHNSDPEDCCATWADGTCEEPTAGGECAALSDFFDCGYCPQEWLDDGYCDEVELGGSCPAGTDAEDCCGTPRDGICEEQSKGDGACPDFSDWYDCGYCPGFWLADGYCIENEQPWGCPAGSDSVDCAL